MHTYNVAETYDDLQNFTKMLPKNVHRHIKLIRRPISSVISLEMIFWHLLLWWLMLQDFFYSANGEETGIDARFTLFGYIGIDWLIEASWNKICEEKTGWEFEKMKENREIRWHAVLVCKDPCEERSQYRLIISFLLDWCCNIKHACETWEYMRILFIQHDFGWIHCFILNAK